jgi:hypothetical protein
MTLTLYNSVNPRAGRGDADPFFPPPLTLTRASGCRRKAPPGELPTLRASADRDPARQAGAQALDVVDANSAAPADDLDPVVRDPLLGRFEILFRRDHVHEEPVGADPVPRLRVGAQRSRPPGAGGAQGRAGVPDEPPDLMIVLTNGGPGLSTFVISLLAFQTAYESFNFGAAAAVSVVMLVALMVFTLLYLRFSGVTRS